MTSIPSVCFTLCSLAVIVLSEMCLDMSDCSITACTHGSTMTCEDGECTCTASSSRTCLTRGDCASGGRGCHAHGHGHGEWHCVDGMCRCRRVDRD